MPTFRTVDTSHKARNGQQCAIVRTISEPDETHDADTLPMHVVRFSDGFELEVFDDELTH